MDGLFLGFCSGAIFSIQRSCCFEGPFFLPQLAPFRLLLLMFFERLLYAFDVVGTFFLESLEVEVLDEDRQRRLPRLLLMIGHFAEPLGVHAKLSGHLDMGMAEVVSFASIDPGLVSVRDFGLSCHHKGPFYSIFIP